MTLFGTQYAGIKFDDLTRLSYDTFVQSSEQDLLAPSIGMEVWGPDGADANTVDDFLGTMVFEPYQQGGAGTVRTDAWQSWDATSPSALWWSSKDITDANGNVVFARQSTHTLDEFRAAFAANPQKYGDLHTLNGIKTYVGSSSPSSPGGWDNFVGYVDNLQVVTPNADTMWDFATGIGPCVATVDAIAKTYTLTQDCSTYRTIDLPDGWTLDGANHTITAVEDSAHPSFRGAVVASAQGDGTSSPASMHVQNLNITTQGFADHGKNSGGNLYGVVFTRAGGSVDNVSINGISHGNGVQEGRALYVSNLSDAGEPNVYKARVDINNVSITNYQKSGFFVAGNVHFSFTNSVIGQAAGPNGEGISSDIAANSVTVLNGAGGSITDDHIALNEYDNPAVDNDALGILVTDSRPLTIARNVISGADGDAGLDVSNSTGVFNTSVDVSCTRFERAETVGDLDRYGDAVTTYDGEPVAVTLSDSTFIGWNDDVEGPVLANPTLGQCPPRPATNLTASGGDNETDVKWTAADAPDYAPLIGYTVTVGSRSTHVAAGVTSAHLSGLKAGEDLPVRVVAESNGGSTAASTTLYATNLRLTSAEHQLVVGQGTYVRGKLMSNDQGADLGNRNVVIEERPAGSDWRVLRSVSTDADGSFQAWVRPGANTSYRASYAGAPDLSSRSNATGIDVATRVSLTVSDRRVRKGDTVLFAGAVEPDHDGADVLLQREVRGDWKTFDSDVLSRQSTYSFHVTQRNRADYTWRVVKPADADHATGVSREVTVDVR